MKAKKAICCKLLMNTMVLPFVILVSSSVFSFHSDKDIYRFSGKVISQQDSVPVYSAHIVNMSMGRGTTSSDDGSFSFSARIGDKIMIRALGFHTDTLIVNHNHIEDEHELIIALSVRIYDLSVIDIYNYSNYEEFKHAFLNFDHEDEYVIHFDLRLPEEERRKPFPVSAGPTGIIIDGPITYLYDKYSRRGKEIIKTRAAEASFARDLRVTRVINHTVISQLTDLEDEEEINEFIAFCKLDYDIIDAMKEYQVYLLLLEYYAHYKAQK